MILFPQDSDSFSILAWGHEHVCAYSMGINSSKHEGWLLLHSEGTWVHFHGESSIHIGMCVLGEGEIGFSSDVSVTAAGGLPVPLAWS